MRHARRPALLAVLVVALLPRPSGGASSGALDPGFGTGGLVTTAMEFRAGVLQPDGRLILVGTLGGDFALERYLPDGTLDVSFGTGGRATTDFGTTPAVLTAVALDTAGRVVASGRVGVTSASGPYEIARYDGAGTLDATFGTGGLLALPTDPPPDFTDETGLVLQPDGMIVAGGMVETCCGRSVALVRVDDTGTADPAFGTGGVVTTPMTAPATGVLGLLFQPDGRILALADVRVIRYLPDGSVDTSFGTDGMVSAPPAFAFGHMPGAALQPDGRLVVIGAGFLSSRFNADGSLDTTFGSGGVATTSLGSLGYAGDLILVEPDGRIVLAGISRVSVVTSVARLGTDGSVDASFGRAGAATPLTNNVQAGGTATVLLRQPDGKLIVGLNNAIVRLFGGACGNGLPEASEDCDDGNLVDGDGCSATCCTADADGDGICDAVDPCTGGVTPAKLKVKVTSGGTRLSVAGDLTFFPSSPVLDPTTEGFRLLLASPAGTVLDITVPPGTFADPPGTGWKVRNGGHTKWTWKDGTKRAAGGRLNVVMLTTGLDGLVKVRVKGKTLGHDPIDFGYDDFLPTGVPLQTTFVLSPPVGTALACGAGVAAPLN